ncbi:hypothetical protein J6590_079023 [Homalodisca vitripennis]|nr:hypothetical protein J6590_079023 [Homalodisca vitripennis]
MAVWSKALLSNAIGSLGVAGSIPVPGVRDICGLMYTYETLFCPPSWATAVEDLIKNKGEIDTYRYGTDKKCKARQDLNWLSLTQTKSNDLTSASDSLIISSQAHTSQGSVNNLRSLKNSLNCSRLYYVDTEEFNGDSEMCIYVYLKTSKKIETSRGVSLTSERITPNQDK